MPTVDPKLAATEFHETLGVLGQHRIAGLFNVAPRSVRRWQSGDRHIPLGIDILLHLITAGIVTIEQIEQVAGLVPIQTNGGAEPSVSAPEQSAKARIEAAAPAGSSPTTAEQVRALRPGVCHWPVGDPAQPGFHFCGASVVTRPYCGLHRTLAYTTPPMRSPQGQKPSIGWSPESIASRRPA
jgi:GcrA cell cycle regulator